MRALRFIRAVFYQFPRLLFVNIVAVLAVGLADIAALVSVGPVVDYVMDPSLAKASTVTLRVTGALGALGLPITLGTLLATFIGLSALRNVIYVGATYVMLRTKYSISRRLIVDSFADFFHGGWPFFSQRDQGQLVNTFSREIAVVGDALSAMSYLITYVIEVALYLVVPFWVSWQVAGSSMATAVVLGAPFLLLGRIAYRWGQVTTSTANDLMGVITEHLGSAKVVLGFGNETCGTHRVRDAYEAHRRIVIKSQTLAQAIPQVYYPLGLTVVAVALFVGRAVGVPFSETTIIVYSFLKIVPLIGQTVGMKSAVENALPSYEQVARLRAEAKAMVPSGGGGGETYEGFSDRIAFSDVGFTYPDRPPVLAGVDLEIPKGAMVAVVGPSGVGKTTVADLLMGLLQPTSGQVLVDGRPLSAYDTTSYRHRIGYVPQDPALFNMSIRDNLTWADNTVTDERITDALARANASDFVAEMPGDLATVVGDRGVRLSGGQVQRIALARALVRDPEILVLDEATSSLDPESERLIQSAIESIAGQLTMVVIAHRLSTVRNADVVYVLGEGRVTESGTFAELSGRADSYLNRAEELR